MESVFSIVPAGPKPFSLLLPIGAVLLVVLAVLGIAGYASQRARFVLSERGIAFAGDVYGSSLRWSELRLADARIIDPRVDPGLRPRSRRFGTALPGYAAGWFRLADGERALLYVTNWQRVLYIPTTAGYALLLSPAEPQKMLDEARRRAGHAS